MLETLLAPKEFGQYAVASSQSRAQNFYNIANRDDDGFIKELARQGIAYVPFFPLGGFTPLQSAALDAPAASLRATPMQIALAWLLQRAPNILLIPGTSLVKHLCETSMLRPCSLLTKRSPPSI